MSILTYDFIFTHTKHRTYHSHIFEVDTTETPARIISFVPDLLWDKFSRSISVFKNGTYDVTTNVFDASFNNTNDPAASYRIEIRNNGSKILNGFKGLIASQGTSSKILPISTNLTIRERNTGIVIQPVTTQPMTTQPMTTQPMTTKPGTTGQIAIQPGTTGQGTTGQGTTGQGTTGQGTTGQGTTGQGTTGQGTTQPVFRLEEETMPPSPKAINKLYGVFQVSDFYYYNAQFPAAKYFLKSMEEMKDDYDDYINDPNRSITQYIDFDGLTKTTFYGCPNIMIINGSYSIPYESFEQMCMDKDTLYNDISSEFHLAFKNNEVDGSNDPSSDRRINYKQPKSITILDNSNNTHEYYPTIGSSNNIIKFKQNSMSNNFIDDVGLDVNFRYKNYKKIILFDENVTKNYTLTFNIDGYDTPQNFSLIVNNDNTIESITPDFSFQINNNMFIFKEGTYDNKTNKINFKLSFTEGASKIYAQLYNDESSNIIIVSDSNISEKIGSLVIENIEDNSSITNLTYYKSLNKNQNSSKCYSTNFLDFSYNILNDGTIDDNCFCKNDASNCTNDITQFNSTIDGVLKNDSNIDIFITTLSSMSFGVFPNYSSVNVYNNINTATTKNPYYDPHPEILIKKIVDYCLILCENKKKAETYINLVNKITNSSSNELHNINKDQYYREYARILNISVGIILTMGIIYEYSK